MHGRIELDDAQYAMDLVSAICSRVGPGTPATPEERRRAEMIRDEMASHLGEEQVWLEEFQVSPWASLNAYPVSAVLMLLAALLSLSAGRIHTAPGWLVTGAALALSVAAILIFVLQFIYGIEILDGIFQQRPSVNVVGSLRAPVAGEVRRLLIFSGHHDSAPENPWFTRLGYGFFAASATWILGFLTVLVLSVVQFARAVASISGPVHLGSVGWILLVFPILPATFFGLLFNRRVGGGGSVPGAVDNLSGSALAVAMCRLLAAHPALIPSETEVRFITFGSEEAGLRGSRRYVKRHLDELRRLDARLLNFEMVAHPEICILTSDVNGTVKHSPEAVREAAAAAERAGVPYRLQAAFTGIATDAGPFSRGGIKATTLMPFQIPQQLIAFYHQPKDTPEVLSIEAMMNVLKVSLEWIGAFEDRDGGKMEGLEANHA